MNTLTKSAKAQIGCAGEGEPFWRSNFKFTPFLAVQEKVVRGKVELSFYATRPPTNTEQSAFSKALKRKLSAQAKGNPSGALIEIWL